MEPWLIKMIIETFAAIIVIFLIMKSFKMPPKE